MHFSPEEMTDFVQHHLGPKLEADGYGDKIILGYDQNRAGIKEWVDVMYATEESLKYYDGTAIHWYESTYEVFPDNLQYAHNKAPNKYLIETEGCIDAQVPVWKDDAWYWKKEATDWGWDWAWGGHHGGGTRKNHGGGTFGCPLGVFLHLCLDMDSFGGAFESQ